MLVGNAVSLPAARKRLEVFMKFTTQVQGQTGTVRLEGRFTFETHPAFRSCTHTLLETQGLKKLVLDMELVTHMDASSLGAVLLLREASVPRVNILLRKPSKSVMGLLRIVQFEKLFEIIP
jgi:anti-anti-sigma factor